MTRSTGLTNTFSITRIPTGRRTTPLCRRLLARLAAVAIFVLASSALAESSRQWLPAHKQREIIVPILQQHGLRQMHPADIARLVQQFPDWKYMPANAFYTVGARDPQLGKALTALAQEMNRRGDIAPLGVGSITSGAPGNGHPCVLADSNFTQDGPEYRARWTDGMNNGRFPSTNTGIKQSPMCRLPNNKGMNLTLWAGPASCVREVGDTMNSHAHEWSYLDHGFAPGDCAQVVAEMAGLMYQHGDQRSDPLNPFFGNGQGVQLTSTNNAPTWDRNRKGHYGLHQQQLYGFTHPDARLPPVIIHAANSGYAAERWNTAGETKDQQTGYPVAPEMQTWIHAQ